MKKFLLLAVSFFTCILASASADARSYITEEVITTSSPAPYCREFTQTFTIAGQTQTGFGTACLQEDGAWEIQTPATNTIRTQKTIRYVTRNNRVYFIPVVPYVRPHEEYYRKDGHRYKHYEHY